MPEMDSPSTLESPTPTNPVIEPLTILSRTPLALTPTPCAPDICIYTDSFPLARPIAPPGRDSIDTSYRFGSTQNGKRDPHHGVEFLNSTGTPVLAAAGGVVVVAGDDSKTVYGLYPNFYGNLVVLQHQLSGFSQPVFTLYAHLSKVLVQTGQTVQTGDEIGLVGMTGVATGSHLHFEVRLGENTYRASRNPELWLAPHQDENGTLNGGLAGRVLDQYGEDLQIKNIVVDRLPGTGRSQPTMYLESYEEKRLIGLDPWQESFALGDLAPGQYRISFVQYGMQEKVIQVFPGELTLVTIRLGSGQ
jgi:murein DD-endopeptidase MepM/ murein hydrolase activator NlpD